VSLHDASHRQLRGMSDAELLVTAADQGRAVVTDDARHFLPLHRESLARGRAGNGLVLFANRSFPRHRPDAFVRSLVVALDALLDGEGHDAQPDGRVVWLSPT
jgi:hypothetical protein